MSLTTHQDVGVLLLLVGFIGYLVIMFWPAESSAKQDDPWESPESEHQGPWGSDEMRGDSDEGEKP